MPADRVVVRVSTNSDRPFEMLSITAPNELRRSRKELAYRDAQLFESEHVVLELLVPRIDLVPHDTPYAEKPCVSFVLELGDACDMDPLYADNDAFVRVGPMFIEKNARADISFGNDAHTVALLRINGRVFQFADHACS